VIVSLLARLLRKLDRDRVGVGCWFWTAATNRNGYGVIGVAGGRTGLAHRVAYELLVGPIPSGLEADHLCRTPACCNPQHVELVPHRVNVLRGRGVSAQHARKLACPACGGAYQLDSRGKRTCRPCALARYRRRHDRERGNP